MARGARNDWIEARALLQRGAREHLIIKPRHGDDDCPWEFPGGRTEPRESPEAALRRVLADLFGVQIDIAQGQPPFAHNFGTHSVTYRYYLCQVAHGEIRAPQGAEIRWILLPQLREYHFDAPTLSVVEWLLEN